MNVFSDMEQRDQTPTSLPPPPVEETLRVADSSLEPAAEDIGRAEAEPPARAESRCGAPPDDARSPGPGAGRGAAVATTAVAVARRHRPRGAGPSHPVSPRTDIAQPVGDQSTLDAGLRSSHDTTEGSTDSTTPTPTAPTPPPTTSTPRPTTPQKTSPTTPPTTGRQRRGRLREHEPRDRRRTRAKKFSGMTKGAQKAYLTPRHAASRPG